MVDESFLLDLIWISVGLAVENQRRRLEQAIPALSSGWSSWNPSGLVWFFLLTRAEPCLNRVPQGPLTKESER